MSASRHVQSLAISRNVMVPMRDGCRLATDVYRPATDGLAHQGKLPCILGRTSYDKENDWLWMPVVDFFTRHSYVVVVQDLRGRYVSEGDEYYHTANEWEGRDGHDTIEWIAAQPWSNGRVGMVGSSHGAIVQQVAALHSPAHLTSIWPDVGPTNIYAHMSREGGAMMLQMFGAIFMHAYQDKKASPEANAAIFEAMRNMKDWVYRTPFKPGQTPLALFPYLEQTLFNYYCRGMYDEWWQQEACDQEHHWDRHADIPAVFSGGWFDPFSSATTRYFEVMSRRNKPPQWLIMGPWTHDGMRSGTSVEGDVDFGPEAAWGRPKYHEEQLRWFNAVLKGKEDEIAGIPPVRLFVMGGGNGLKTLEGKMFHGGSWRSEKEWPIARTELRKYFLHRGGALSATPASPDVQPLCYSFDPTRPVPTIGGNVASFFEMIQFEGVETGGLDYIPWYTKMRNIVTAGPFHQKEEPWVLGGKAPYLELASRPDVLVFETEPLDHAVEVTGPIRVDLWISSSAKDTDFTAKLVDVYAPNRDYPTGYHMILVDSILRVRYREGWDKEVFMEPGSIYPIHIDLPPTSNLFQAGHRIRIDISSSNFPRFDLNPNTGEPMGRHTALVTANNCVYVDSTRPSHVTLPIIG